MHDFPRNNLSRTARFLARQGRMSALQSDDGLRAAFEAFLLKHYIAQLNKIILVSTIVAAFLGSSLLEVLLGSVG